MIEVGESHLEKFSFPLMTSVRSRGGFFGVHRKRLRAIILEAAAKEELAPCKN